MSFRISSPAFADDAAVPRQFTCDGDETQPAITVSEPPAGTKSYAIVMDDPDAPKGTFTHWLAYDIPADGSDLRIDAGKSLQNGFGREGYGGPCPPRGDRPHRYSLNVFAVDVDVLPLSGETRQDLERALEEHTLASARVTARYARQ